ncbi:MAG: ATP-binding cassette domain-containing protein [Oscillospiraceae bacterium]|nr:ATP-binding cassette domain-containing protein [Oscillospiraceae bacterium]
MLQIEGLCVSVNTEKGEQKILDGLDLTVEDGKFVVITGPNGGGKTTLAKAIMGIIPSSAGKIIYNGEDITSLNVTERAKKGISYGFQQPPRFKGISVKDLMNVAAGRELSHDECCAYLTKVGLCAKDYLDREVDVSLSGGEVKRIEIATILARKSGFMIYDEPEAGIDLWSFSRLTETFSQIHASNDATLMIISHQERILSLADEIILVSEGKVSMKGPADEVFPYIMNQTEGPCPLVS